MAHNTSQRATSPKGENFVCSFTEFRDGKLHFHGCPYRNRCGKYNKFDPSAIVKAWEDFGECGDYREFALKGDENNSEKRTVDDHSKRFQAIAGQVYDYFRNYMEKTAYDWLMSRGWDGKDIEAAKELSKGYEIVRYPDFTCEVCRIAENATEATEQTASYCLHCPLHVDCDKTHCPYDHSNTALEKEIDRAIFDRGFKRFKQRATTFGGIGNIRYSKELAKMVKEYKNGH